MKPKPKDLSKRLRELRKKDIPVWLEGNTELPEFIPIDEAIDMLTKAKVSQGATHLQVSLDEYDRYFDYCTFRKETDEEYKKRKRQEERSYGWATCILKAVYPAFRDPDITSLILPVNPIANNVFHHEEKGWLISKPKQEKE